MKRFMCAAAVLASLAITGFAEGGRGATSLEVQIAYGFPNHEAVDASSFAGIEYGTLGGGALREVGSAIGGLEAKVILARKQVLPAFVGGNAFTSGNNLALEVSGEFSPVSINANFQATLTPIAFLKFAAGLGVGTGWDIGFMGLGINDAGNMEAQDFGGIVYRAWAGGTFQFDLAALLPGEWNHVVMLASPKVQYQAYSNASSDQAWVWEADKGMNFNGLKLTGSYLLGYQMPLALDLAGLLLQTEGWLGAVRERAPSDGSKPRKWGSDFTSLTFGPLFDFRIDDRSTIAILPQFKTGIKWTDASAWDKDFTAREYEASYLYFYRVAFDYSLEL